MNVLQFLQDNGPWIAAAATLVMAIMVFLQTKESRRLGEENRKLTERARFKELVGQVITPLLRSADIVYLNWSAIDSDPNSTSKLLLENYLISMQVNKEFDFSWTLYQDLGEIQPLLRSKIENYDKDAWKIWKPLLDLDSRDKEGKLRSSVSIYLPDAPNAASIRGTMKENAGKFEKKTKEIDLMLEEVRDKYRKEYNLTEEELEESTGKINLDKRGRLVG